MFARIQTSVIRPADDSSGPTVSDMIASHPGFAGLAVLTGDDGGATMVSLWASREDAELAAERTAAIRGPRPTEFTHDDVLEVDADQPGPAAREAPVVAILGEHHGPMSPERLDAARFAGSQRIAPVLRQVAGLVRVLVLWHPTERRMVVMHLATSTDALHAVRDAVMSSTLLPGEDPDLLPGPDRVRIMRVAAYRPTAVPTSR